MNELLKRNEIESDDVISVFFTATSDITVIPPARAVRDMGMEGVPLLCAQEMEAEVGPPLCVRLMMHIETEASKAEVRHVFLRGAVVLRPDLVEPGDERV